MPPQRHERFPRECERLALAETQLKALEESLVGQLPPAVEERIANLKRLRGVGQVGAMRLALELFWRNFNNRRQVGACAGLVPQPYDSGDSRAINSREHTQPLATDHIFIESFDRSILSSG